MEVRQSMEILVPLDYTVVDAEVISNFSQVLLLVSQQGLWAGAKGSIILQKKQKKSKKD